MRTLEDIFASQPGTDKNTWHAYGPLYAELLAPYRETATFLLEIGVRDGSSLRSWSEYFVNADIHGIDDGSEAGLPIFTDQEKKRIFLHVADTTRPSTVLEALNRDPGLFDYDGGWYEPFDVIIDDGLHHPYGQVATWATLSPFLAPGGIWITEDIEDISFAQTMQRLFGGEVIDLRERKGRHDDILFVWRKPK
jgi:hypothetical protein